MSSGGGSVASGAGAVASGDGSVADGARAAARVASAPPAIIISTRDFLAASIYLDGQIIFERFLHAFVTRTMRAKYPPTQAQEEARRAFLRGQTADAQEARDLPGKVAAAKQAKEQAAAVFEADRSNTAARDALIDARKKFSQLNNRLKNMAKDHKKRRRERNEKYKHPRWVEMCHAVLGKICYGVPPNSGSTHTSRSSWDTCQTYQNPTTPPTIISAMTTTNQRQGH